VNELNPPPGTGIIMEIIPYMILAVLALICMGVFAAVRYRKKKNRDVWDE